MMLQIIAYTIGVAAAFSVVALCAERLARWHGRSLRLAWAAAMLLSLLLPAAMIYVARPVEVADMDVPYLIAEPAEVVPAAQDPGQTLPSVATRSAWELPQTSDRLLITAWLATSFALAIYLFGANLVLRRRMKGWRVATVQDQEVLISEVTGPALLGAFSPRIVMPLWLLRQPHGTQALILQHEQQHVLARDALLIMAGLVAIVAVPWNLPLWWQWRRLRQAVELDCDSRVLDAGAEAHAYAEVLLAITQRSRRIPIGALGMSEPVHALERRIAHLLPDAIRYGKLQTMVVLLLGAAGAGGALALDAPALPGRGAAPPTAAPQGGITPAPRSVQSASAVQSQASAQSEMKPASRKVGEHIVTAVTRGDIEDLVTATGTLTPRESADVRAQVSGQIRKLHVGVGDVVQMGDLLAEIDAPAVIDKVTVLRPQLRVAESELKTQEGVREMAERDYKRLLAEDSATGEARLNAQTAFYNADRSVVAARAQVAAQTANLRIEEGNLDNTRIVAPIGGTVMKVHVKQGQGVNATQNAPVVMQIANLSTLMVVAAVPEADVNRLHKGMAVYFTTLGSNSQRWYGELNRIEPTPRVRNGIVLYNALFEVRNDRAVLRPQMTAAVYFVSAEARNVLRVPFASLQQLRRNGAGRTGTVMVMKPDGKLEARPVVVGVSDRVYGEVLEGLKEGDEVVVGP